MRTLISMSVVLGVLFGAGCGGGPPTVSVASVEVTFHWKDGEPRPSVKKVSQEGGVVKIEVQDEVLRGLELTGRI